jgi:hypothetical protein
MKTILELASTQRLYLLSSLLEVSTMQSKPFGFKRILSSTTSKLCPSKLAYDWVTSLPKYLLNLCSNFFKSCFKDGNNTHSRGSVDVCYGSYYHTHQYYRTYCFEKLFQLSDFL